MQLLFWFDAFDELEGSRAAEHNNIPSQIGFANWVTCAQLVVTCRRNTLTGPAFATMFRTTKGPPEMRYLLPFSRQQMVSFLQRRGVTKATDMTADARAQDVLGVPFVLSLFADTHREYATIIEADNP